MVPRRARAIAASLLGPTALILAVAPYAPEHWRWVSIVAAALPATLPIAVAAVIIGKLRSLAGLLGVSAGLAAAGTIAAEWSSFSQVARESIAGPSTARLVIVTHNVGSANPDPARTVALLAATDADVLLLQETDGSLAPFLASLTHRFPYRSACRDRCSLAIFSRLPMTRARYRFRIGRDVKIGPGLLHARVRLPDGTEAQVATVHLSRHLRPARAARQRRSLTAAVNTAGTPSLILAGDFNLVPWSSAMRGLDRGLHSMTRLTRALPTFPARPFPLVAIDHVFVGPGWHLIAVDRLPDTGSDHRPVRAELVWQPGASMLAVRDRTGGLEGGS